MSSIMWDGVLQNWDERFVSVQVFGLPFTVDISCDCVLHKLCVSRGQGIFTIIGVNTSFEYSIWAGTSMLEVSAFSDITSEVGNDYHNHHGSSLEFTIHIPRPHKVAWHTMDMQLNRFYLV